MKLEEYAVQEETSKRSKSRCSTCSLDPKILAQIEEGRTRKPKPITYPMMSAWLEKTHGIKIQQATIRNHFISGHHSV